GCYSENSKEVSRYLQALNPFRLIGAAEVEILEVPGGQTVKGRVVAPPVEIIGYRDELLLQAAFGIGLIDRQNPRRVAIRHGMKQERIQNTEHGCVHCYAEPQDEYRQQSEGRRATREAEAVLQILKEHGSTPGPCVA